MKLNTGIIAHMLPAPPLFVCGNLDHRLCLSDVRFFIPDGDSYNDDILYFTQWDTLRGAGGGLPPYMLCVGGGAAAADFLKRRQVTGLVADGDPLLVFGVIQSIFLRFNQLETELLTALREKAPTGDILNCIAAFFENHAVLYDSDRNLIGSSDLYQPGQDDPYWKETLETGRRSEKMLAEAKKAGIYPHAIRTPTADYVELGPGLPTILTYSYFESGKRLATLVIARTNKPLSVYQLKLLENIAELVSPSLVHIFAGSSGSLENLRSVLTAMLNKELVDSLLLNRCLGLAGWSARDDYVLLLIEVKSALKKSELLTRFRHIYERIFADSVCFAYHDRLVLLVHNDNAEVMAASLPKLETQLLVHNAVCGFSLPFTGISQLNAQYENAEISLLCGDRDKRIRFFRDSLGGYLITRVAAHTPLFPLCHREAVRIYEYDLENGTELLLTLETYLRHNKSLKSASEELFIHRSTMTYRLGCIEKISKLNLDDPSERLHILLSCFVLGILGRQAMGESLTPSSGNKKTAPSHSG